MYLYIIFIIYIKITHNDIVKSIYRCAINMEVKKQTYLTERCELLNAALSAFRSSFETNQLQPLCYRHYEAGVLLAACSHCATDTMKQVSCWLPAATVLQTLWSRCLVGYMQPLCSRHYEAGVLLAACSHCATDTMKQVSCWLPAATVQQTLWSRCLVGCMQPLCSRHYEAGVLLAACSHATDILKQVSCCED